MDVIRRHPATATATAAAPGAAARNADIDARRVAATPLGVGAGFTGVYAERALNAEIWDVEGRRFFDFGSGIAVLNSRPCKIRKPLFHNDFRVISDGHFSRESD